MTEFKRPIELAGLKARLQRARELEHNISETGKRYDRVLDQIEAKLNQSQAHAEHLERYDQELADMVAKMIGEGEGSNGPPTDDASGGHS